MQPIIRVQKKQNAKLARADRQIALQFKNLLRRSVAVEKFIVFGSRARAEAVADSDMDVFIQVQTLTPAIRKQIREIAWEVGLDNGLVISTFVTTANEIENGPTRANPLLAAVLREGVIV